MARCWAVSNSRMMLPAFGTWVLVLRLPMTRQEHLRLDVDEPGRHLDECSGVVQILGLDSFDGGEELTCDPGDRDFEDIDVLLTDEVQQQIERPLKTLDVDDKKVLLLEGTFDDGQIHSSMKVRAWS